MHGDPLSPACGLLGRPAAGRGRAQACELRPSVPAVPLVWGAHPYFLPGLRISPYVSPPCRPLCLVTALRSMVGTTFTTRDTPLPTCLCLPLSIRLLCAQTSPGRGQVLSKHLLTEGANRGGSLTPQEAAHRIGGKTAVC